MFKIYMFKGGINMGIEFSNEQIYAIYDLENWWNSRNNQVFEISGSPGTGKTTLIMYFIEQLGLTLDEVAFVAYTGKAATQMSRNGIPGRTIMSTIYNYERLPARDEDGKIIFTDNFKPKMVGKFVLKEKIGKKIKLIVVDEGGMVSEKIGADLLSFNIPVVVLGDLNQLPPVFGKPFFLKDPDVILTQIMRQKEGDPIIWLSQQILHGKKIGYGVYGKSAVISKHDLTDRHFSQSDIVLTATNRLRWNVNQYYRESLKGYRNLEVPHIGEQVMCRKNNWNRCIDDGIYFTNGMTGFVDDIYKDTFNGKTMCMDFRPDFMTKSFRKVKFDYRHMYTPPSSLLDDNEQESNEPENIYLDKIEYAYAITTHSSQGSQYPNVLFLKEDVMRDEETNRKLAYTAVTRAINSITIVQ